jgi:hypothetical protein
LSDKAKAAEISAAAKKIADTALPKADELYNKIKETLEG